MNRRTVRRIVSSKFLLIFLAFPLFANAQLVDSLCSKIEYSYIKFNDEKRYQSPGFIKNSQNKIEEPKVQFVKVLTGKLAPVYYLGLKSMVKEPMLVQHGVILTLMDGKTIVKPRAMVTTDIDMDNNVVRRSYFPLVPADLELLRRSSIKEFKLYTDTDTLEKADDYKIWLNCMTNKN